MDKIEIIAHRGASAVCPENTMIAFERALELGATGIETDVQMSADGRLVLIHDETLQRTGEARAGLKISLMIHCALLMQAPGFMRILPESLYLHWKCCLTWCKAREFCLM